mgnify:CR=1 FL=1
MLELRTKARSLMMFAGMVRDAPLHNWEVLVLTIWTQLRFRLTSDTYAKLTRLDVHIA